MAKVILMDSPSWQLFDPKMHLHLGILYLAGSLRAAGHDVKVLDCHKVTSWDGSKLTVLKDKLEPCDILGMSTTTANLKWGQELAAKYPAKIKVLGGPHVTHIFEGPHWQYKQPKYFKPFDYLMWGECEEAFVQFCDWVDGSLDVFAQLHTKSIWQLFDSTAKKLSSLPGLIWDNGLGYQVNLLPVTPDVTKLPPPAFDLWQSGFQAGGLAGPSVGAAAASSLMTASLYTARGCPYGCTFCADARTKLREETYEQIEWQVRQLATLGVRAIRIQDDTYTIKVERAKRIADILHDYGMRWRGTTRVNLVDNKLFDYLASRGCTELGFGIEHGSNKMLKAMAKGTTAEKNEESLKACHGSGIVARAFLMIGFPGETEETIDELRDWVLRVRPDAVTLSLFQPFPGSDVWNHPEKYGVKLPDAPFDKFWQLGADTDPDTLVLSLPTISKQRLYERRRELVQVFEEQIGKLDRKQMHGNVGTYGPQDLHA